MVQQVLVSQYVLPLRYRARLRDPQSASAHTTEKPTAVPSVHLLRRRSEKDDPGGGLPPSWPLASGAAYRQNALAVALRDWPSHRRSDPASTPGCRLPGKDPINV